jgi:hypothetical protein
MFVASTLIGFTVMQRYPKMKVVVAHGKASWMEEVLEKMEASTRVIPLLHTYPVRTDPEEMWEEGHVMLGFDAEERLIQKLPHDFAAKVVWGSRYPHHDTTSAWDAIAMLTRANVEESLIGRMLGGERRPAVWHCAGTEGWRLKEVCATYTHVSIWSPSTRPNSRGLLVTRVTPRLRACAAISMSIAPIGVPCRSRAARIAPYARAAAASKRTTSKGSVKASKAS